MSEPLLPALAKQIGIWFPELKGRSLAVSEAEITRENMPTLPLCMVALVRETADDAWKSATGKMDLVDTFIIEFMMQAERYKRADGSESPFWAFFDYAAIRDKLWTRLKVWAGPQNERIEYVQMDVEADQYSVNIAFTCRAHYKWCPDELTEEEMGTDGQPITSVTFTESLCVPKELYCGPAFDPPDCDPCNSE